MHSSMKTFLARVEERRLVAKQKLRHQVDFIVDDFFGQLVTEFTSIINNDCDNSKNVQCSYSIAIDGADNASDIIVNSGDSSSKLLPQPQQQPTKMTLIENVICEPIIEMCLFGDVKALPESTSVCPSHRHQHLTTTHVQQWKIECQHANQNNQNDNNKHCSEEEDQQSQWQHLNNLTEIVKQEKVTDSESEDTHMDDLEILKCFEGTCEAIFANMTELNLHLVQVHNVTPYQCAIGQCNRSFDAPNELMEHQNSVHNVNKQWICSTCDKVMKNERTLYMHRWRYHKQGQFKCTEPDCDYTASYRIQLRTHHIRFHDLGKFACPFPGCGRSFNRRNSLKRHERIHLRLKPYRCKWGEGCEYASELRSSMIDHVRVTHFRLPRSRKEQLEMNIGDDRDPADYFEVLSEGLDLLEPVLEHVSSVLQQNHHKEQQNQHQFQGRKTRSSSTSTTQP